MFHFTHNGNNQFFNIGQEHRLFPADGSTIDNNANMDACLEPGNLLCDILK
jgi:hypothetical protein